MDQYQNAVATVLQKEFATISELIQLHAVYRPQHLAYIQNAQTLTYQELDQMMDLVVKSLQRNQIQAGDAIAICASTSFDYVIVFLGALRAGVVVAPLAPSTTAEGLLSMITDADASIVFLDQDMTLEMASVLDQINVPIISVGSVAKNSLVSWLAPSIIDDSPVNAPDIRPDSAFNIIYSSGTTGKPKGIVQPYAMRWAHVQRGQFSGYSADTVTLLSTPLYSNTTLVSFFATVAMGGTSILMAKFDVKTYLSLAQQYRVTHTMLVPVQYQRLMAYPDFDQHDLSSYRFKFSTSAPFSAALKKDVLVRWPGGLTELYGMTEGGGTCMLLAHQYPAKLHTVGQPAPGSEFRIIDEQGQPLPVGQQGEIVGRSMGMMSGYHKLPEKTAETEWYDADGVRFIRTGDVGRFDEDGFLTLMDRKKDMIISGGFNIYPSDIEAILSQHPDVADLAVVGVPSSQWGETPIAFVVVNSTNVTAAEILSWANTRLGKMQRLAHVEVVVSLPRSPIGKILKRELRDQYQNHSGLG
ncbi:class I adenylate-forming enzyme family protein [Undibacterium sp. 5I1]|uniref:class I adenylate-forming enzyme family protein n=1 Tax=unclassified Undibacterium TaxID=2630295 RepID=UPI002AB4CF0B|nr:MULTISPECIES: class I adenylate-forming enzyme family protein [unclassified Undibacterium]MDY7538104.1 class I adenylate-forming enzyme family protein [Undibacterium sp. 5I1]MEB0232572.1 class I adenylate-forming enzyme family protein [Undibacterium sp. 10I3]MEB0259609.1 class I adenylate-forming enzyme family protein [Undibacterium sp. 5I1]